MSVRIGINPLTWTNDDMPELGAETPLEVCLSEGRQAGYAGFELGQKFPRDAAVLQPVMRRHGLELVSGWYSAQLLQRPAEQEIEAMQAHLQLLKAMGCKVMVFAEVTGCVHGDIDTPVSRRLQLDDAQWREFGARMTTVARYLRDQGIALAYHQHMGTVVESGHDVDALMAHTGAEVGLLLDTGHLLYAGAEPVAVVRRHGARIVHVHCKDVRAPVLQWAKQHDASFLRAVLEGVFTVPGDGCIDYYAVAEALKTADYQGWLVVEAEQDPARAHPLTYATLGYKHLSEVVAEVGL